MFHWARRLPDTQKTNRKKTCYAIWSLAAMCCHVPVRAAVNHLCAVFAVIKLDSPGSLQLLSSCFHSADADVCGRDSVSFILIPLPSARSRAWMRVRRVWSWSLRSSGPNWASPWPSSWEQTSPTRWRRRSSVRPPSVGMADWSLSWVSAFSLWLVKLANRQMGDFVPPHSTLIVQIDLHSCVFFYIVFCLFCFVQNEHLFGSCWVGMKEGLNVLVLSCRVQRQGPRTRPEGADADQELPCDRGAGVWRGGDLRGTKGRIFTSRSHRF